MTTLEDVRPNTLHKPNWVNRVPVDMIQGYRSHTMFFKCCIHLPGRRWPCFHLGLTNSVTGSWSPSRHVHHNCWSYQTQGATLLGIPESTDSPFQKHRIQSQKESTLYTRLREEWFKELESHYNVNKPASLSLPSAALIGKNRISKHLKNLQTPGFLSTAFLQLLQTKCLSEN